jgi:hypothetical protein
MTFYMANQKRCNPVYRTSLTKFFGEKTQAVRGQNLLQVFDSAGFNARRKPGLFYYPHYRGCPVHVFGDYYQIICTPYLVFLFYLKNNHQMKKSFCVTMLLAGMIACFDSCKKDSKPADTAEVITATGDITASVNEFRNLLGSQLNTTTGATSGRREINWDGVADSLLEKPLPDDFFNPVAAGSPVARQRGLTYAANNGKFMVSNNNFADINPVAAAQFKAFSGNKTFANTTSNLWEVQFRVPGAVTAAAVKGFGAVFSDVDLATSTYIEYFNGTKSLGKYFVPPHDSSSSFSFLGVYFKNGKTVTRLQVSHQGNLASGVADISNNGTADLILLDDFLYSEPLAH